MTAGSELGVCVGGETSADSRPPATPDLNTRTHTHVQHKGLLCGSEREAERVITSQNGPGGYLFNAVLI